MDWQQLLALLIVACTALVFAVAAGRRRQNKYANNGCGGCSSGIKPKEQIVFRARKGQRPEVLVKNRA